MHIAPRPPAYGLQPGPRQQPVNQHQVYADPNFQPLVGQGSTTPYPAPDKFSPTRARQEQLERTKVWVAGLAHKGERGDREAGTWLQSRCQKVNTRVQQLRVGDRTTQLPPSDQANPSDWQYLMNPESMTLEELEAELKVIAPFGPRKRQ